MKRQKNLYVKQPKCSFSNGNVPFHKLAPVFGISTSYLAKLFIDVMEHFVRVYATMLDISLSDEQITNIAKSEWFQQTVKTRVEQIDAGVA